jgi:arabinofuranosyltransferase
VALSARRRVVGAVLAALFAWAIVRYAWVAEDAYITLRTVDNFVHGYGLRWNVAERVQAYTHPLWLLALSPIYAVTREDFLTLIFCCVACSLLAFALVQRLAASTTQAVACGAILILSPAFVDFSTSGLENALSHLLLAAFAFVYLERRALQRLVFVAALCMVNRLDLGLLLLPAVGLEALRAPGTWREKAQQLAVGLSPLVAWELFSLFYYGFAFPNTAYAKLATGLSAGDSFRQGLAYFASHLTADPLTLGVLAAGVALGLASGDAKLRALATGVIVYLVYLLRIGGDFMLGRFLTPPLLVATIVIGRAELLRARPLPSIPLTAAIVALGIFAPRTPLRAPLSPKPPVDAHGIADERLIYAAHASLAARHDGAVMPDHYWVEKGRALRRENRNMVTANTNVGFLGYFAGPKVHIIDLNGLTDPLLARLPIQSGKWRIGHFTRDLPLGYHETCETGTNRISDAAIAQLYDQIAIVTRGPLLRWKRLAAIARGPALRRSR